MLNQGMENDGLRRREERMEENEIMKGRKIEKQNRKVGRQLDIEG